MKKISILLLSVLICFSFLGCNNEKQTQVNAESSQSSTVSAESETQTDKEKNEETKETENGETTKSQRETQTDSKSSGGKNEEKSGGNSDTKSDEKTTAKKSSTTKEKTTTKSTITCYVTIECTVVLKNMDNLKEGHEKYVPSDGYIVSNETVTVKNGSSAYDAVKEACSKNGVKISTTGSGKSVYIAGFNNLDEFDCGNGSGWTYYVNGSFPPKSCGAYTLSDGDSIRFSYVC